MKDIWTAKRKPSKVMASKRRMQIEQWKNATPEEKLMCAFRLHEFGMKLKETKIDENSSN